jgi:hypothetical protein
MKQRILELAMEELQRQKAAIDADIEEIQGELRGFKPAVAAKAVVTAKGRRRSRTSAQRMAQSERMKKYWAAKRSRAAGSRKYKASKPKGSSKAISDAMKAYWAKKKAEKAVKAK